MCPILNRAEFRHGPFKFDVLVLQTHMKFIASDKLLMPNNTIGSLLCFWKDKRFNVYSKN